MKKIFTLARKGAMLCAALLSAQCGIAQITFTIPTPKAVPNVTAMEYFIDSDPGFGAGTAITIATPAQTVTALSTINPSSLSEGIHRVYFRAKDTYGRWGQAYYNTLVVRPAGAYFPATPAPHDLTALEYFFDTDPGYKQGTIVNVTPTQLLQNEVITANIFGFTSLQTHTLFMRVIGGGTSATASQIFGKGVTPLPLSLLSFEGRKADGAVNLNWEVASNKRLRLYEVERSTDGQEFDLIGCVSPDEPDGAKHARTFTDWQPLLGTGYYRLRMGYDDGEVAYSPIVRMKMDVVDGLGFSNPVSTSLQLFGVPDGAKAAIRISDMQGRIVRRNEGSRSIDVSDLPAGQYLLECELDGARLAKPFQKL